MTDNNNLIEQLSNLTILQTVDLIKELEAKWGVSAAAPAASAAAAPAAAAAPEQSEFTVTLASVGEKKIDVIKAIRSVLVLGLAEAKILVDSVVANGPTLLKEGVSKEEVKKMKEELEAAGAKLEIK